MGFLGFHHLGTFLLLADCILMIIAAITAPVVDRFSLLKVDAGASSVHLGALGYCIGRSGEYVCTDTQVKYDFSDAVASFPIHVSSALNDATGAFVLNLIAAGVAGLAFLIAAISHRVGFLFAAVVGAFALIVTACALVVDFVILGIVKHKINDAGGDASYGVGAWCVVAALVVLFFGSISTCFSCFTDRKSRRGRGTTTTI